MKYKINDVVFIDNIKQQVAAIVRLYEVDYIMTIERNVNKKTVRYYRIDETLPVLVNDLNELKEVIEELKYQLRNITYDDVLKAKKIIETEKIEVDI